jgi:hypothetical protein
MNSHIAGAEAAAAGSVVTPKPSSVKRSCQSQSECILFDELNTDNTNGGGQVPAIVISPFAKTALLHAFLIANSGVQIGRAWWT